MLNLSVDIDKMAPELISLVEKASHFQEQWQQSSILKQMIQRYYSLPRIEKSLGNINCLLTCLCVRASLIDHKNKRDTSLKNLTKGNREYGYEWVRD